jgi:hypothetical protein
MTDNTNNPFDFGEGTALDDMFNPSPKVEAESDKPDNIDKPDTPADQSIKSFKDNSNVLKDKDVDDLFNVDEDQEESPYKYFAKGFFEHHDLEWSDELLKEDSLEGFNELLTELIEANSVPQYSSQEAYDFDEYIKAGGRPVDFFKEYLGNGTDIISDSFDLDDASNQKAVLREHYAQTTKWSPERIEKEIKRLERDDELEDEAREAHKEVIGLHEERKQELIKQQQIQQQERIKQEREYVSNIANLIDKGTEKDLGFSLSTLERQKFKEYVLRRDEKGLTGYEKDLRTIPNADIKLALALFQRITEGKLPEKATNQANKNLMVKLRQDNNVSRGSKIVEETSKDNGLNLDIFK